MSAETTASLVILVDSTGAASATKQLDDMTAAGARAEAATVSMGESAEASSARIKSMVEASLAQANANGIVGESERSLAERAGLRIEATAAQIAATQAAVAAQDAQMVSTAGVLQAQAAATVATDADTVAIEANTVARKMNSRTAYSLSALISDAATGQFSRSRRELAALGNETGIISKLFTPMGLAIGGTAAALGLFVKAVMDGEEEMSAFNKALISTGGYAGVTAEQLNGMAEGMAGGAVTIGKARDAITALATSGRFTGDQIRVLAQATVDAGELMGQSVKQVVDEFTKLQESPVKASEALNEQYHYLTASVLQQIIALQNQGNTIGAADLAMTTYADTLRTRTAEAATQLGTLQRAWDSVKQSASFAWDAMEGVGVKGTPLSDLNDKYVALLKEYTAVADLASGNKPGFTGSSYLPEKLQSGASGSWGMFSSSPTRDAIAGAQALLPQLQAQIKSVRDQMKPIEDAAASKAATAGVAADVQAAGTEGVQTLAKLGISLDGIKSKTDKVAAAAKALYDIHLAGGKLPDGVDFNGAVADMPEGSGWNKIKNGLLHGSRAKKDPAASAFDQLTNLDDQANTKDLDTGNRLLDAQAAALLKIAEAGGKAIEKGKDIATVQAVVADAVDKTNQYYAKQEAQLKDKNVAAITAYDSALKDQLTTSQQQIDLQIESISMGTKEFTQYKELLDIKAQGEREVERLVVQMNKAKSDDDKAMYAQEIADHKAFTDQRLQQTKQGFKDEAAAQASWLNGAKKAMQDYADAGQNVAGLTQGFFTNSIDSMTNALTNFATTGKLSFKSLVASILSDLAKMEMRIAASKILQSIIGGGTDTSAGGGGAQMASIFDGGWGGIGNSGYAKGGAFDSTGQITAFAMGGVVDSATPFTSGGKLGVLGEAGPEAIMPLSRGSDGKLGVKSSGGGGDVIINTTVNVDQNGARSQTSTDSANAAAKQLASMVEQKAKEVVMRATQPGGILWQQRMAVS